MKTLYITSKRKGTPAAGRRMLTELQFEALSSVPGTSVSLLDLQSIGGPTSVSRIVGYVDGVSRATINATIAKIGSEGADTLFLDGSNLGMLLPSVRRAYPAIRVVTFFHNVEARFFLGAFRARPSARSLGVIIANYLAERAAVKHSDQLICMTRQDSLLLKTLYGRGATDISSISIRDSFRPERPSVGSNSSGASGYALFVGGGFYANLDGISWFARKVAPRISRETVIIGRGLDKLRPAFGDIQNVKIVGEVEDLNPWYRGSVAAIAPIFDGSGMKTKVAEALMHGKGVIGTPNAFAGYEQIGDRAGVICTNADEFVRALSVHMEVSFDGQLRELYEEKYSFQAARLRLARILERGSASE